MQTLRYREGAGGGPIAGLKGLGVTGEKGLEGGGQMGGCWSVIYPHMFELV